MGKQRSPSPQAVQIGPGSASMPGLASATITRMASTTAVGAHPGRLQSTPSLIPSELQGLGSGGSASAVTMARSASGATLVHDSFGSKQRKLSPVAVQIGPGSSSIPGFIQGLGSAGCVAARTASGASWVAPAPELAMGTAPQMAAVPRVGASVMASGTMGTFLSPAFGTLQSIPDQTEAETQNQGARLRVRRSTVPDPPPQITYAGNFAERAASFAPTSFAGTPLPPPPPSTSELARMTAS